MALATGLADIALATDCLGEGRVPAACCGLFAYRPSPGALGGAASPAPALAPASPPSNALGAEGLQGLAVLAKESRTLIKAAEALGVTGKWTA